MKNMLALVGVLVIGIGGLGWYLNWFNVSSTPGVSGHRNISIDVNSPKIAQDIDKGENKVINLINKGQSGSVPNGVPTSIPVNPENVDGNQPPQ